MKKLLSVLLATVMLLTLLPLGILSVSALTYGDLTYTISDGQVIITGYTEEISANLIIPSTIEGYAVTSIDDDAFYYCDKLRSVTIPDSVTSIGNYAFRSCTSLTEVVIGNRVATIGWNAFDGCYNVTHVYYRGSELERNHIRFGSSNTPLTDATWHYQPGITGDCTWRLEGTHLTISGNGAMKHYADKFGNTAPWGDKITSVTIEDGVTMIGANAFHYCYSLTSVDFGNTVEYIASQAFRNCIGLTKVVLPDSVNYISSWAFQDTTALTSVTLGKGPIDIRQGAFCYNFVREPLNVYYNGNETDREVNLTIGEVNNGLTDGAWYYADDPISDTVDHSVMDTTNGNGLAFRFELTAKGVTKDNRNVVDLINATINYLGTDCKLIGMGAIITNSDTAAENLTLDAVNDFNVVDVPTMYLQEADADSCVFATRIIDVPDSSLERTVYARPYFIVKVDGQQITVYGDVDSATCAEYL